VLGVGLISPASVSAALKVSNALASTSLSLSPTCGYGGGGGGGADVDVDPPLLVFVFPEADPNIDMGSIIDSSKEVLSSSSTLMPMPTSSTVLKTTEMARNFDLTHPRLTPTTMQYYPAYWS